MKKILVLYFTQSGQQKAILESFLAPFKNSGSGYEIHFEELKLVENFPFPWSGYDFFNAFPETFAQQPCALKPLSEKAFSKFDLVVIGYQPWFLTPSRPMSSFLQSEEAKRILKGRPVVTILGCRNMWLGAHEKVKQRLREDGATLMGHIALVDRSGNLTSLITILRWMFTGRKDPFWFFPSAGVSQQDIEHAAVFGSLVKKATDKNDYTSVQKSLNEEGAIFIKPNLVLLENRGQKAFSIWAKFVAAGGPLHSTGRKIRVYVFMYLLPTAIFILTPLLWVLSNVLLLVKRKHLLAEVEYYKQNSFR
jgi:hypothetical protein